MTVWTQLWPVRVIGSIGGGATQWLARTTESFSFLHNVLGRYKSPIAFTAAAEQSPAKLLTTVDDQLSVNTTVTGSGELMTNGENIKAESVFKAMLGSPTSGWEVAQTFTNLDATYPANGWSISRPSGSQDWSNGQNATGLQDAQTAAVIGSLLNGATDAILELTYPTAFQKDELDITSVTLDTYWGYVGNIALASTMTVLYSVDGSAPSIVLSALSGNETHAVGTVETFDITSVADTWAKISALQLRFRYTAAGGNTQSTGSVDAVEMKVQANKTVTNN
jgi:hypothetical protein